MKLNNPPKHYDPVIANKDKEILEAADLQNYKHMQDVQIGGLPSATRKQRLILIGSVNGNRYSITVDDTTSAAPVLVMTKL